MTNADKFKGIFGIYATELWAKSEKEFLEWLNADVPETNVGDMISRQSAIEIFTQLWDCIGTIMDKDEWEDVCRTTANELPSVQRKGKWIDLPIPEFGIQCSCCGMTILRVGEKTNYCPSCGAKMKGNEDDRNEMD